MLQRSVRATGRWIGVAELAAVMGSVIWRNVPSSHSASTVTLPDVMAAKNNERATVGKKSLLMG